MMNPEAQVMFDDLIKLESAALNEEQKAFLIARRDYLSSELKARYADFLPDEEGNVAGPDYKGMTLEELTTKVEERELEMPKSPTVAKLAKLLKEADEEAGQ